MQTIKQKMDEILGKEVETQKKKQFQLIKDVLFLFEQYLNNYGHEFLSISETKMFEKKYQTERIDFCEQFTTDKITEEVITSFAHDFLPRKVIGAKKIKKYAEKILKEYF